jgi:hypothetical protein
LKSVKGAGASHQHREGAAGAKLRVKT